MGSLIGGAIMTIYFTAGGLLGTAWVNTLQLMVMLAGFVVALPFALDAVGGFGALAGPSTPPSFGDFMYSSGSGSGWTWLVLLRRRSSFRPASSRRRTGGASARRLSGQAWR